MREGIGEGEEGRDEGLGSDGKGWGGMGKEGWEGGRGEGGRETSFFIFTAIILEAVI